MKWQNILKETIAQNRVKEIEDIDIDIEDDDCLRWLKKLYSIITRYPEGETRKEQILEEKHACNIKNKWEKTNMFERKTLPAGDSIEDGLVIITTFKDTTDNDGYVVLNLVNQEAYKNSRFAETWEKKYEIRLTSLVAPLPSTVRGSKENYAVFSTNNKEKVIKVTKEICNYLNLDYNRLLGAVA